jgi:hypothetical protein
MSNNAWKISESFALVKNVRRLYFAPMMTKHVTWIGIAAVALACAGKSAPTAPVFYGKLELLTDQLSRPLALAVDAPDTYFVVHAGADQKGVLTKIHGPKSEVLFSDLNQPQAIDYDARHDRMFVAEGNLIKIFRTKKKEEPPVEVRVTDATKIDSISYSVMNARAYLCDSSGQKIFSLDPKKKSVELILGPEAFDKLGHGSPKYLLVSNDGMRLYLMTSLAAPAAEKSEMALVTQNLRKRNLTLLRAFPGANLVGLGLYRMHLLLADPQMGEIESVSIRNGEVTKIPPPVGWKGPLLGFTMDLGQAVFLGQSQDVEKGNLVRFPVAVKD